MVYSFSWIVLQLLLNLEKKRGGKGYTNQIHPTRLQKRYRREEKSAFKKTPCNNYVLLLYPFLPRALPCQHESSRWLLSGNKRVSILLTGEKVDKINTVTSDFLKTTEHLKLLNTNGKTSLTMDSTTALFHQEEFSRWWFRIFHMLQGCSTAAIRMLRSNQLWLKKTPGFYISPDSGSVGPYRLPFSSFVKWEGWTKAPFNINESSNLMFSNLWKNLPCIPFLLF